MGAQRETIIWTPEQTRKAFDAFKATWIITNPPPRMHVVKKPSGFWVIILITCASIVLQGLRTFDAFLKEALMSFGEQVFITYGIPVAFVQAVGFLSGFSAVIAFDVLLAITAFISGQRRSVDVSITLNTVKKLVLAIVLLASLQQSLVVLPSLQAIRYGVQVALAFSMAIGVVWLNYTLGEALGGMMAEYARDINAAREEHKKAMAEHFNKLNASWKAQKGIYMRRYFGSNAKGDSEQRALLGADGRGNDKIPTKPFIDGSRGNGHNSSFGNRSYSDGNNHIRITAKQIEEAVLVAQNMPGFSKAPLKVTAEVIYEQLGAQQKVPFRVFYESQKGHISSVMRGKVK